MHIVDVPQQPSPAQLRHVRAHLPYSLRLYRRLQVAQGAFQGCGIGDRVGEGGRVVDRPGGGTSPLAHIVFVYDGEPAAEAEVDAGSEPDSAAHSCRSPAFAAAYVDLSQAPETAAFIYASDEDTPGSPDASVSADPADRGSAFVAAWRRRDGNDDGDNDGGIDGRASRCRRLVLALLRHIRSLAREPALLQAIAGTAAEANIRSEVKVNMHDGVRYLLQHQQEVADAHSGHGSVAGLDLIFWESYDNWLIPVAGGPLPGDPDNDPGNDGNSWTPPSRPGQPVLPLLTWDVVRRSDVPLVKMRTHIPRMESTLLAVPSVGLRCSQSGALVAWAFVGVDGSLWTLHCEPEYRGRGVALAVVQRLIHHCSRPVFAQAAGESGDSDAAQGWFAADVSAANPASQSVMRRLGGQRTWASSWAGIRYDSLDE